MSDETEEEILRRLRANHKAYKRAQGRADEKLTERNDLIRTAVQAGIRPGTIARELHLSRPRIRQILGLD